MFFGFMSKNLSEESGVSNSTKVEKAHFSEKRGEFPPVVYKYRDWDDQYARRMITHREVYFSHPKKFEDPYDCRTVIQYGKMTYEQIRSFIRHGVDRDHPKWNEIARQREFEERIKIWESHDSIYFEKGIDNSVEFFRDATGILSLTALPLNDSMWDDYAKGHTGFCVGFNSEIAFQYFDGGGPVIYEDDIPVVLPEPIHDHHEIMTRFFFTKLKEWEFEKEYRVIVFKPPVIPDYKRKVVLPREAFREVILGKNMSWHSKKSIIYEIKKEIGDIPIIEL